VLRLELVTLGHELLLDLLKHRQFIILLHGAEHLFNNHKKAYSQAVNVDLFKCDIKIYRQYHKSRIALNTTLGTHIYMCRCKASSRPVRARVGPTAGAGPAPRPAARPTPPPSPPGPDRSPPHWGAEDRPDLPSGGISPIAGYGCSSICPRIASE